MRSTSPAWRTCSRYTKSRCRKGNPWSAWMRSLWCCTPMSGPPRPMRPGQIARRDSEYERRGTANVFCGVQPKAGRHFTKPTSNRSSSQFADYLVEIVASYPEAGTIHLVMDNLSSHKSEGAGGPVRRKNRRPVVGAFHGALHPETRQLAEPGGDRDQPVLPSMPGPAEIPIPRSTPVRSKGMELENEPRPSHHQLAVHAQEGSQEVRI